MWIDINELMINIMWLDNFFTDFTDIYISVFFTGAGKYYCICERSCMDTFVAADGAEW